MAIEAISKFPTHFTVQDPPKPWQKTAKRVVIFVLKIVLFPWALCELAKYVTQRIVMTPLYPAQSRIVKYFEKCLASEALDSHKKEMLEDMISQGFEVKEVVLQKNGVNYSGILAGHKDHIGNGQWIIQATGNCAPIEYAFNRYAERYSQIGFNTLLINGPAVGHSEGQAKPHTMGGAQEIGISYLETAVQAKKIVMAGSSLGGAAMGQAVLQHEFKPNVRYLSVRQMTFDCSSNICAKIIAASFPRLEWLVKKLVQWSCEMDSVAASQRLQELGIKEVIIQSSVREFAEGEIPSVDDFGSDGVIHAEASLAAKLVQQGIVDHKMFIGLRYADHNSESAIFATADAVSQFFKEKDSQDGDEQIESIA